MAPTEARRAQRGCGRDLWWRLAAAAIFASGLPACCFRYRLGQEGLFPSSIQTVYVPIFESDSYRRNLGERLTEAITKEIHRRTPYTVVNTPDADSMLSGRIIAETKRVLVESPLDEPRQFETNMQVLVAWTDRQGAKLQPDQAIPIKDAELMFGRSAFVQPELGQSVSTGHQQVVQRLAQQIVSMMEAPW